MSELKRTNDRKTANFANANGNSRIANAFSIPAGRDYSCPNATDFCSSICYAGKLEKLYKGVRNLVLHNWELVKDAGAHDIYVLLDDMLNDFENECDKRGANKLFRIHTDGDFFNSEYITAFEGAILMHPDVHFWTYTRVPDAVKKLSNLRNLSLYFSSDPDNKAMIPEMRAYGVKIATVAQTFEDANNINKGTKCLEQSGSVPLISEKGGACIACGLCPHNRRDIVFSASKK